MGGPNGPLGELVRALSGGNAALQSVVDRIDQDMQDEELDEINAEIEEGMDERMAAEYAEEDEGESDSSGDISRYRESPTP